MARRPSGSPRILALKVLSQFDPGKQNAADLLDAHIDKTESRGRLTDLVYGVIRNRITLDHLIECISQRQPGRIKPQALHILRIGFYEILYCPQTPEYAIVNDAVEAARKRGGAKTAGFVNAVLRKCLRNIAQRDTGLSEASALQAIITTQDTGCVFRNPIWPDPADEPDVYLRNMFSMPLWLVRKWLNTYGFEQSKEICLASNRRPGVYLFANPLKCSLNQLGALFKEHDLSFRSFDSYDGIKLEAHRAIETVPGYAEGWFLVQDPTARRVAQFLPLTEAKEILDLCAAPGTKTAQIAWAADSQASITATDSDTQRLLRVNDTCRRLGITNVQIRNDAEVCGMKERFDLVLVDVPCSNTGVLARRVEVRHRLSETGIARLIATQRQILEQAIQLTRPGGSIIYSTCSILLDENEQLVSDLLSTGTSCILELQRTTVPQIDRTTGFDCDGGYVAVLKKQ